MKNKTVPKLRFSTFKDNYTTKNFSSVFKRITKKNSIQNNNVLTISAAQGLVSQLKYYHDSVASKDLSGYYLLEKNDFAFNKSYSKSYPVGAIKRLTKYEKGVVSPLYICFRSKEEGKYLPEYFEHYFESGKLNRQIYKIAHEGARNHGLLNISVTDFFKDLTIKCPPYIDEQKKIAEFLSSVDQKIHQLKQKKKLFEEYKKGVMQKLFSQEIRFKDENGEDFPDWNYKELGDISDRITDKNEDEKYDFVLTNSAVEGVVSQTDYFDKSIANKSNLGGYYIVKKDDFVYNPRISSEAPVGPIKRNKLKTGVMSPLYSVFRIQEKNLEFFEYFFETTLWHRYMHSVANFGARHDRMNITVGDFQKLPIPVPPEEEREKITDFINSVTKRVKTVTQKLELAEKFKKGLLQQMFV